MAHRSRCILGLGGVTDISTIKPKIVGCQVVDDEEGRLGMEYEVLAGTDAWAAFRNLVGYVGTRTRLERRKEVEMG